MAERSTPEPWRELLTRPGLLVPLAGSLILVVLTVTGRPQLGPGLGSFFLVFHLVVIIGCAVWNQRHPSRTARLGLTLSITALAMCAVRAWTRGELEQAARVAVLIFTACVALLAVVVALRFALGSMISSKPPDGPSTWEAGEATEEDAPEVRIFVSYRREDARSATERVCAELVAAFGRERVFKDVDSLSLGKDFRQELGVALEQCDVFVASMGPRWSERIHNATDYPRVEVETAIARKIPIIPVLVEGAELPDPDKLPESLRDLVYYGAIKIRNDPDFAGDVERLIEGITDLA